MKDLDALERYLADIDEILATARSIIPTASRFRLPFGCDRESSGRGSVQPVDLMRWVRRSVLELGDSDGNPPASRN
jgi:hypothetical protein